MYPLTKEYELPDYKGIKKGYVNESNPVAIPSRRPWKNQNDELEINRSQAVKVGNERFWIPEVIFRPSDIESMKQVSWKYYSK